MAKLIARQGTENMEYMRGLLRDTSAATAHDQ
jgi:hypothetical protein